jgi:glycosyltransferase involved in cell wall biosynthesis
LRILFALHQFFPEHHAGTEVVTLGLARELRKRGHEPYVFAAKRSAPHNDIRHAEIEDYSYEGIPVRRVGRPNEGPERPYRLDYDNPAIAPRAEDYAREVDPDLVHAMHFFGLSMSVVSAFKGLGLPVVFTATDFWTICPVLTLVRHDGAMCAGPELHHCVRCMANDHPTSVQKAFVDLVPDSALRAAGRLAGTRLGRSSHSLGQVRAVRDRPRHVRDELARLDRIVTPSTTVRDLLASNGIPRAKLEVCRHGLDARDIQRDRGTHRPGSRLRVGYVGGLSPHKGCDTLIRAFRSLPRGVDAELTIHGHLGRFEAYVAELRRLAEGDDRIAFAGRFPPDRVGSVLSGMDVVVVPSRWYENAPVVIAEAFAAGVPVVATNLGGMAEAVRSEENGLLFEREDEADLARQLRRLAAEPALLDRLTRGIPQVRTVADEVTDLERIYRSVLS